MNGDRNVVAHFSTPVGILLVDDDAQVGEVIRDLLLSLGYEVLSARHGAEAIWRLEEEPDRVVDGLGQDVEVRDLLRADR